MIDPSGIPQFTGDFDELDKDTSGLRGNAIGIRDSGMDVHSRFQMLEAFYTAPEADDLFATTRPVMDTSDAFATKLETVADALDTYSAEARPPAKRLEQLKAEATAFVDSVKGDDDWTYDEKKIHRHQELMNGVAAAESAFREAERRAATKISALVGGPKFVADDGHHTVNEKTVMYGYDRDILDQAKELPWGTPESESHHAWEVGYWAKSYVWDGLVIDNMWGSLKGLAALSSADTWRGLGDVVSGIGQYTAKPYDALMDWAFGPDKESADEKRQKKAAREFAKSLVAWDMWDENPARAAATVTFNGLTLGVGALVGSVAKGAEAGAIARGASVAAKVGEYIDPVSAALKATGKVTSKLPKLSDLTGRISAGIGASADSGHLHSVIELDDGSKVLIEDGTFVPVDKHGNVISNTPRHEPSVTQGTRTPETPAHQGELTGVGAGSRESGNSAHAGGSLPAQAHHDSSHGGGGGDGAGKHQDHSAGHGSGPQDAAGSNHHPPSQPADLAHSGTGGGGQAGGVPSSGQGSGNSGSLQPPPVKEWKADDNIVGPARGKTLLYPNSRHDLSGVRGGTPDTENTVILPETKEKVRHDIAEIAAGRAQFDPQTQRYTINGRRYAVEPHGRIFPVDGPGLVQMDRIEYTALKHIMRANGDLSKLQTMFSKAPQFAQNPQAVQKAIALYRTYYP
ncbi:hypothetical protein [Streptomyces avermitilis]|uniref:hypothetical protein n=1 Tax=Streptomyces avermitilis TaxID=33903 RepID=UPI0038151257